MAKQKSSSASARKKAGNKPERTAAVHNRTISPAPEALQLQSDLEPGPPVHSSALSLRQARVLQMQRRQGNAAVQRYLSRVRPSQPESNGRSIYRQTSELEQRPAVDAMNMSITPAGASMLSNEQLAAQANQLRSALGGRTGPVSVESQTQSANLAALEMVARNRGVSTAQPSGESIVLPDGRKLPGDAAGMRHFLEQMIIDEGESKTQAYIGGLQYYYQDLAKEHLREGPEEMLAWQMVGQAEQAKELATQQWRLLHEENRAFIQDYERTAVALLRQTLEASKQAIKEQKERYGISMTPELMEKINPRPQTLEDLKNYSAPAFVELEKLVSPASVEDMPATRGLARAAAEIRELQSELDRLHAMRNAYSDWTNYPMEVYGEAYVRAQGVEEAQKAGYEVDSGDLALAQRVNDYEALETAIRETTQDYEALWRLKELEHPILAAYRSGGWEATGWEEKEVAQKLAAGGGGPVGPQEKQQISAVIVPTLEEALINILQVENGLNSGKISVWKLDRIMDIARLQSFAGPGSMRERLIRDKIAQVQDDESWRQKAIMAVTIGLALLAAIPTGGSSLVGGLVLTAELGGLALDGYLMYQSFQDYHYGVALAGTHFDPALTIAKDEPSLGWLAIELAGAGIGAIGVIKTFRQAVNLRQAAKASGGQMSALGKMAGLTDELNEFGQRQLGYPLGDRIVADVLSSTDEAAALTGRNLDEAPTSSARFRPDEGEPIKGKAKAMSHQSMLDIFTRSLKRPGPGADVYHVYKKIEDYDDAYRRLTGDAFGDAPLGFVKDGRIHLPPTADTLTVLHESLHWASDQSGVRHLLGAFVEEGLTESLARRIAGPEAKRVYEANVAFVEELTTAVGQETLDNVFLHRQWGDLRTKLEARFGSAAKTSEFYSILRQINDQGQPSVLVEKARAMLSGVADTPTVPGFRLP